MLSSIMAAVLAAVSPAAAHQTQDVRYAYCMASEPTYGRYHLFSTVFTVPAGTYHVGVANSFHSFAEAYDGREFDARPSCIVTFGTWQEAEDDKNRWISRKRDLGHSVSLASWSYHGG